MDITLKPATVNEAESFLTMLVECFNAHQAKYGDSPFWYSAITEEAIAGLRERISEPFREYLWILADNETVGGIRVVWWMNEPGRYKVTTVMLLPKHQNRGIGQQAMRLLEDRYPDVHTWELSTVQQEGRNQHFYEKLGYRRMGEPRIVNERLSLVEYKKWVALTDIPAYPTFTHIEALNKGWSRDRKFNVETADGQRLLLRIAGIAEYERKKNEFEMLKRVAKLGVPASRPVDFGVCNSGKSVYQLLTWIDGKDAEAALPTLTNAEQYALGVKAGEILRRIHSIPAPDGIGEWSARYFTVTDERLDAYRAEGVAFDGNDIILSYLENNRELLKNRPQCRHHGDYHEGNLIISDNGDISVIDWHNVDFGGYGDPWYELGRCFSDIQHYAVGEIHGYFGGEPSYDFWRLFAYYAAASAITSIVWMQKNAPDELSIRLQANLDVLRWFDNFNRIVPTWYLQDFYVQYIDGVPLKLKKSFDLDFIHRYGKVFKVFDDQDSGNLCFGVQAYDGKRYFVKFAGAPTERGGASAEEAVANLKRAVLIYQDLSHPNLIHFVKAEEIGGGFAMVFEWVGAICAQRMYPADYKAFKALSLETKERIFEDIVAFHTHVAAKGYVAIDFYDGIIMWDAQNERTIICDIDFYQKSPYVGKMGLWGSARFVSPEERRNGAVIDEVTNAYTMGATAFCLFADSDRSLETWPFSPELYAVVKRATSEDRSQRQQSIRQLQEEWRAAQ